MSTAPHPTGLSLRAIAAAVFALLLMGIWIEYEELINNYGGPFAENSPPNSAVCVILVMLGISWALYRLRSWLGLQTAELIFIYTALLVAAPLMTQGMWHRFFGLVAAIPHERDFKSYESLPDMLWPHGQNLCANGRFEKGLDGFLAGGSGTVELRPARWKGRDWKCPVLDNGAGARTTLRFSFPRRDPSGREQLVPGENFLFTMLVKAENLQRESVYSVTLQADDTPPRPVVTYTSATTPTFASPEGFLRVGMSPVGLPTSLREKITFEIALQGPGQLTVHDIQFFNSQAVEGCYNGRKMVRQKNLAALGGHERDFTVVKPDHMLSLAGLRYLVTGFIPLDQWARPALAWTILIGALFIGFFGFNVLMRRQWVETERFSFPMNIFPRQLFETQADEKGRTHLVLFRNRMMWAGFALALLLALLKGLNFYFPQVPAPMWDNEQTSQYVNSPLLKAYLSEVWISLPLCLLSIALLVETDILFSLWSVFLLFQFTRLFGKAFNLSGSYPGYPWEFQQAIGSFIGFACLAIWVARNHLGRVFLHLIGRARMDDSQEVVSYRWAAALIALSIALLAGWGAWTGMGVVPCLLFFGFILVCGFAASKIRAECGAPAGYWMPYFGMMFAGAMGGFAVFGATGMLTATICSGFMCVACFLFIAPVQIEMMELGRHFRVPPRLVGWGLALGLFGGLFIGGYALLSAAYGQGADNLATSWPYNQNWYFTGFREGNVSMDRAFEVGQLSKPETAPLNIVSNLDARGLGIGFAVVCLLSVLRTSFMWFPFHPIGFVLATSHFARSFWFVCFLAWLIRLVVLRIGGAHTIRRGLIPFAAGMFLACAASIMIFDIVGFILRWNGISHIYCKWP